jgi:Glycosyl transferases group 1
MTERAAFSAHVGDVPRILEIGDYRLMREAYPESTHHWSTSLWPSAESDGKHDRTVTLASLPRLARALASADYDVVVVQPGTFRPWHLRALSRSLFRRSALRGHIPYFRHFGQEMILGRVAAPIAVWDWDEPPFIYRHNVFLLDRAVLYFKRELPPDHWRVFMGTLHHKIPTPRFRLEEQHRRRIAKLRPISLGLPLGREALPGAQPIPDDAKTADIFFTGRIRGSSTVREAGVVELLALRDKGYRIDIPRNDLPVDDYLRRCAAAWLTWSPEGFGYECFRTYEAAICGSVPVVNRQSVHRYKPLRDGEHCFYYDVEPGGLTQTLEAALAGRARLSTMARAARDFVLKEHTQAALARHIVETTLSFVNLNPAVQQVDR